ncbi:hypothetical protein M422DRAFT_28185 [Sphaerobolus stellatus SS14]|nr:hypothetical protein M422DRAFT_28185 [Sphaerobolus stellatus SS14]
MGCRLLLNIRERYYAPIIHYQGFTEDLESLSFPILSSGQTTTIMIERDTGLS